MSCFKVNLPVVIVTGNEHTAGLPALSVKVYLTTVLPRGNVEPGVWVLSVRLTSPEMSVADGSTQTAIDPVVPSSTTMGMGDGQLLMTGGVVSSAKKKCIHSYVEGGNGG